MSDTSDFEYVPITCSQLNAAQGTTNNVLTQALSQPFNTSGFEVGISQFACYFSWPNLRAALANNTIGYIFNGTTYNLTLPDGIYQISDISNFIQQSQLANGLYLVNNQGANVYYGPTIVANPVYYSCTVQSTPIPSALPSGWTNPNAITLSGQTPQLIIPAGMGTVLGFVAGTYPATPQTSAYAVNGSAKPQITSVTSVNVGANFVAASPYNQTASTILSFTSQGSGSGTEITITPPQLLFFPCQPSPFINFVLTLYDQAGNQLNYMKDAQMSCNLLFRRRKPRSK